MKSAYELAMERLEKAQPSVKLSEDQKNELAEIDERYRAKVAERELFLNEKIEEAQRDGAFEDAVQFERQLAADRKNLEAEREEKKQAVRERSQ